MRDAPRRLTGVLPTLALSLCLAACGGGSGGGGPGGGGGGGGGNATPTASVIAPTTGVAGLLGDRLTFTVITSDDDAATVRVLADFDGVLATTADQAVLYVGVDSDGAPQDIPVRLGAAPLRVGVWNLFLVVDDGVNAALELPLPGALVVYPAIAGVAPPRSNRYGVAGRTVVFSRGEAEDLAGPLNGDGLADDGVMVLFDAATTTLTQPLPSVSMDVTGVAGGRARPVRGDGNVLAWFTLEADEGANLNLLNGQNPLAPLGGPDVDQADSLISYVIPGLSPLPATNTYAGGSAILEVVGGRVLAQLAEAPEGAGGTSLNPDFDSADAFFGYVDTNAGALPTEWNQWVLFTVSPGPAPDLRLRRAGLGMAAWLTTEVGSPLGADFNGDGDQGDTFLATGDLMVGGGLGLAGTFTAYAGFQVAPAQLPSPVAAASGFDVTLDSYAGYYVDEAAHNVPPGLAAGNDRNGDGVIGFAPAFYNTLTLTETIPAGLAGPVNAAPASPLVYDMPRMLFTGLEAPRVDPALGTNGDGDGGADTQVLYWTDHSVPVPVATPLAVNFGGGLTLTGLALDQGGTMVRLAPGWVALVVNEAANGNQDINGTGAVDFAYLLVQTNAGPAPVVFNVGVVPSATATFPREGIWGQDPGTLAQGVVVRLTEQANGDLDGDLDGIDTFFAFVPFATPTMPVLLDAGGAHCAVAGGRIAITADEALTGTDYDGNASSVDVLLRVFDFSGAVLERGVPCSRLSVPVSDDGSLFAYLRDEVFEQRDLNGDGDSGDQILGLWIP